MANAPSSTKADTGSLSEWSTLLRDPLGTCRSWVADIDSERSSPASQAGRRAVPIVMVTVAVVLLTLDEYASSATGERILGPHFGEEWTQLVGMVWWALTTAFGYLVVPSLVVHFLIPGVSLRDMHLRVRSPRTVAWTVLPPMAIMGPLVWLMSHDSGFSDAYPLYALAGRSTKDYLIWTAVYVLQFVGLEFFFRGFILATTRAELGSLAVWVMMVPYAMIHLYKPFPEGVAAILAGVVLGFVAMRHRSIWDGVALHVSVALLMDALAL